jgi:hypothetical protein
LGRRNCAEGYTLSNTRLVCTIANWAMQSWGEKALIRIAKGVLQKNKAETEVV